MFASTAGTPPPSATGGTRRDRACRAGGRGAAGVAARRRAAGTPVGPSRARRGWPTRWSPPGSPRSPAGRTPRSPPSASSPARRRARLGGSVRPAGSWPRCTAVRSAAISRWVSDPIVGSRSRVRPAAVTRVEICVVPPRECAGSVWDLCSLVARVARPIRLSGARHEDQTTAQHDRSIDVSALCLGVMLLGVREADDDSFAILDRYFAAGGRFFDTANRVTAPADQGHPRHPRRRQRERLLGALDRRPWRRRPGRGRHQRCGAGKADPDPAAGRVNHRPTTRGWRRTWSGPTGRQPGAARSGSGRGLLRPRRRPDPRHRRDRRHVRRAGRRGSGGGARTVQHGHLAAGRGARPQPGRRPTPSSAPGSRSTRSTGRLPAPRRTPSSRGRVSTTPSRTRR